MRLWAKKVAPRPDLVLDLKELEPQLRENLRRTLLWIVGYDWVLRGELKPGKYYADDILLRRSWHKDGSVAGHCYGLTGDGLHTLLRPGGGPRHVRDHEVLWPPVVATALFKYCGRFAWIADD